MSRRKDLSDQATEDRGVEGVKARLAEQREEIDGLERHLRAARRRRETLIRKLGRAGLSERAIAAIAGVSSTTVHNFLRGPNEPVADDLQPTSTTPKGGQDG